MGVENTRPWSRLLSRVGIKGVGRPEYSAQVQLVAIADDNSYVLPPVTVPTVFVPPSATGPGVDHQVLLIIAGAGGLMIRGLGLSNDQVIVEYPFNGITAALANAQPVQFPPSNFETFQSTILWQSMTVPNFLGYAAGKDTIAGSLFGGLTNLTGWFMPAGTTLGIVDTVAGNNLNLAINLQEYPLQ